MTMVRNSFVLRSAVLLFWKASAGVLNVPSDYPTIQEAINASSDGDTVLVAPGTYTENINLRSKDIVLASHYILDGNPATIEGTVIDGSNPVDPDTASCVIIHGGQLEATVLEGFTLTGGTGTKWTDEHGAGDYREGGGIIIQYSSPTIRHNMILFNEAIDEEGVLSAGGGAIRVGDGNPMIVNNLIMHNQGKYGGGIVLNYTGAMIKNNIIAHNSGGEDFGGGGIWILANGPASKVVENNTIVDNSSDLDGGGVLVWSTSVTLRNNIIRRNTAVTSGPQIRLRIGSSASVSYSNVEGGWTGTGNIDADPTFADTSYYLLDGSPCIDAGDSGSAYDDPEDAANPGFAEWPAMGGLRNDIGAYGGPGSSLLGTFPITSVEGFTDSAVPKGYLLEQNFPNPFNPQTTIRFTVPQGAGRQHVSLQVFDLLGRLVVTLVNEGLTPGRHEQTFDATGLVSGAYYYRLRTWESVETRKLILIR
jgi:hypothetical protein